MAITVALQAINYGSIPCASTNINSLNQTMKIALLIFIIVIVFYIKNDHDKNDHDGYNPMGN